MKTDKHFKLSRAAKTLIALLCKTPDESSSLKSMLIQSELAGSNSRKQALKSKGTDTRNKTSV